MWWLLTGCAQAQHDYLLGNYPVVREDAAQMCALQVQAEHASSLLDDDEGLMTCIEKWVADLASCCVPCVVWSCLALGVGQMLGDEDSWWAVCIKQGAMRSCTHVGPHAAAAAPP